MKFLIAFIFSINCFAGIQISGNAANVATATGILPVANGGTGLSTSMDLTSSVTGVLPVANGGTGASAPWYIAAALSGALVDLGVASVASYTEMISAGLTLTPRFGSAAAGTMCSTTNAATAPSTSPTTCAAGSESVGISFTIPDAAAAYEVCFTGSQYIQVDSGESLSSGFQLIETPTNAQTLTLQSGNIIVSSHGAETIATGVDSSVIHALQVCSIFKWASVGTKGIRLMYEQGIGGAPDNSFLIADLEPSYGQPNISFTVKKIH